MDHESNAVRIRSKGGNFRFRLIAKNGEPFALSSEAYASRANAIRAAKRLGEVAASAEVVVAEDKPKAAPKKVAKK